MSFMILKRFRNELIILIAILFAIFAFFYKLSAQNFVKEKRDEIVTSISEISRVNELKKLWKNKTISKKANRLKTIVSKSKIKSFKKRANKVVISYQNLTIKELNIITKYIMNNPFQIIKLKISEFSKENYTMELTCKW